MMTLDIIRIAAYTLTSIGLLYCAIDDHQRGNRADIVWAALAIQNISVLALLALDMAAAVRWMEARYLLTPTAIVASVAVLVHSAQRISDKRRLARMDNA